MILVVLIPCTGFAKAAPDNDGLGEVKWSKTELAARKRLFDDWHAAELPLARVIEAAYRRFDLSFSRLEDWEQKARRSTWLPRVQVGYALDLVEQSELVIADTVNVSSGEVTVGPPDAENNYNLDEGQAIDVKLLWNLSSLLYHRDQILVNRERRATVDSRLALARELSDLYLKREKLAFQWFFSADSVTRHALNMEQEAVQQVLESLSGLELSRLP